MAKSRYKIKNLGKPTENHYTAAWANTKQVKSLSNVNIPDEIQVINAKEYVDTNEK